MIITIIPEDDLIVVDGDPHQFTFSIDPDIHAIQWDGTEGEIEYKTKDKQNKKITSIDDYLPLIDERNKDKAAKEKKQKDDAEKEKKDREKADKDSYDKLPPVDKARMEYPSPIEYMEALYLSSHQGDDTELNRLNGLIMAARTKYGVS